MSPRSPFAHVIGPGRPGGNRVPPCNAQTLGPQERFLAVREKKTEVRCKTRGSLRREEFPRPLENGAGPRRERALPLPTDRGRGLPSAKSADCTFCASEPTGGSYRGGGRSPPFHRDGVSEWSPARRYRRAGRRFPSMAGV